MSFDYLCLHSQIKTKNARKFGRHRGHCGKEFVPTKDHSGCSKFPSKLHIIRCKISTFQKFLGGLVLGFRSKISVADVVYFS